MVLPENNVSSLKPAVTGKTVSPASRYAKATSITDASTPYRGVKVNRSPTKTMSPTPKKTTPTSITDASTPYRGVKVNTSPTKTMSPTPRKTTPTSITDASTPYGGVKVNTTPTKTMSPTPRKTMPTSIIAASTLSQYKVAEVSASPRNTKQPSITNPATPASGTEAEVNAVPGKPSHPIGASATYKLTKIRNTPIHYTNKHSSSLGSGDSKKAAAINQQSSYSATKRQSPDAPSKSMVLTERQLSLGDIENIEQDTRGQSDNPEWFKWRQNRITASLAHQISHSRFANEKTMEIPQSYLTAVLGTGPRVQTTAMNWGIKNEKNAVRAYERQVSLNKGKEVLVDECGLFIHPKKNWLAASPDGIVRDVLTGEQMAILEVKCPYKHKDHTILEACADRQFCLTPDGNSYLLKTDHPYYTQVQCQLAVTKMKHADFVVYTKKDLAIVPLTFNAKFWEETETKLEKFYNEAVLPNQNGRDRDKDKLKVADVRAAEE